MAWRIATNLIDGVLDNTVPGKVTGELRFLGLEAPVQIDLDGNFDGECRGKRLVLRNGTPEERNSVVLGRPNSYMDGFAAVQSGCVGRMEVDANGAYLEWYGGVNGRTVLELALGQVKIVSSNGG